jgi:hypothetical protein
MNNVSRFCAAIHVLTFGSGWAVPTRTERWYPVGIPSFKIDRAGKGGVASEECIHFFVREQAAHLGARIDQFLPGAPEQLYRRKVDGLFA